MHLRRLTAWFEADPDRVDRSGILLCLVLGIVVQFGGTTVGASILDLPSWTGLVPLTAICLADLWRRHAPLPAFGVGLLACAGSICAGTNLVVLVLAVDLLYASVLYGSERVSRAMLRAAVVVTVVLGITSLILVSDWRTAFSATLQSGIVLISAVSFAFTIRRQREFAAAERERAEQAERMSAMDREAAVQGERHRMARELHDVIAGHLSAIAMQSEAALHFAGADPDRVEQVLRSVRHNSVQSLAEMRSLIDLLRDGADRDPLNAPRRLQDLPVLLESAAAAGLNVSSDIDGAAVPAAVDVAAFRIVHEALTNAAKHAQGAKVHIGLSMTGEQLRIVVTNELTCRSAGLSGDGAGVDSMRRRAEALGGCFTAGPVGAAWTVRASLPLAAGA